MPDRARAARRGSHRACSRSLRSRRSISTTSRRPSRPAPPPPSPPSRGARSRPAARPWRMFAGTATSIIFGFGQVQPVHQRDVFVDRLHLQARIAALLLADRADRVALVVVRRKHQRLVRQSSAGGRKIDSYCARGSPFWKSVRPVPRISSVSPVNTRSAIAKLIRIVGVAGRVDHVERQALDAQPVAVGRSASKRRRRWLCSPITVMQRVRSRSAPRPVMWSACRCVSTALTSCRSSSSHQLQVAIDLLQHRVDDQRLAAAAAGEQIGVGARRGVEQLAEDHRGRSVRARAG